VVARYALPRPGPEPVEAIKADDREADLTWPLNSTSSSIGDRLGPRRLCRRHPRQPAGPEVAIVERESLGGICLNWGCIPTKALLKSGEKYESLSHLKDYGLSADKVGFDFDAIIQRSRGVAATMNKGVTFLMKKNKIEVIEGDGQAREGRAAPKVVVALKAGGSRTVEAKA
jgi:hypothetical protein